jgi:2-polyprenyl-3-methyl-5-hydroxy-6-metoxy-1,4-benzoquinol methylase
VERVCWCGGESLAEFGGDYDRCPHCETLVARNGLTPEQTLVRDDDSDFYGKRYWLEYMRDTYGYPDIHARARQDLPERCVYWLKALLRYRRPPAKVLEVGAGHGGYTALLGWAGYDAIALDLSPWVADFARARFGIQYLVGPAEDQTIEPASLDVVIANDVVEHLPQPEVSVGRWRELLKPDGILVLQTPNYPLGRSYADLLADEDWFLEHMRKSTEHLYLFSRPALELLLARVGLPEILFEDPIFPYDLCCIASAQPLHPESGHVDVLLSTSQTGPLALALVDAHDEAQRLGLALRRSEDDRRDKLAEIDRLSAMLAEGDADRREHLLAIERLEAAVREAEERYRSPAEPLQ